MRRSVRVTIGSSVTNGGHVLVGEGVVGYAGASTVIDPGVDLVAGRQALAEFDDAHKDQWGQLLALTLRAAEAAPSAAARAELASISRRVGAKLVDLVCTGMAVWGFSRAFGPVPGLLIGWSWFALTDWGATIGKSLFGLEVIDARTSAPCTVKQSVLRNMPVILLSFPYRLHAALLGLGRNEYRAQHPIIVGVLSFATLAMVAYELAAANRSPLKQRAGDVWANTIVVRRRAKR